MIVTCQLCHDTGYVTSPEGPEACPVGCDRIPPAPLPSPTPAEDALTGTFAARKAFLASMGSRVVGSLGLEQMGAAYLLAHIDPDAWTSNAWSCLEADSIHAFLSLWNTEEAADYVMIDHAERDNDVSDWHQPDPGSAHGWLFIEKATEKEPS